MIINCIAYSILSDIEARGRLKVFSKELIFHEVVFLPFLIYSAVPVYVFDLNPKPLHHDFSQ